MIWLQVYLWGTKGPYTSIILSLPAQTLNTTIHFHVMISILYIVINLLAMSLEILKGGKDREVKLGANKLL